MLSFKGEKNFVLFYSLNFNEVFKLRGYIASIDMGRILQMSIWQQGAGVAQLV
jgi:hypothetical protein